MCITPAIFGSIIGSIHLLGQGVVIISIFKKNEGPGYGIGAKYNSKQINEK